LSQTPFPCYSLRVSNTTTTTMTIEEIVRETVEFYSNNARSIRPSGMCSYENESGSRCAVGRCIEEDCMGLVRDTEENKGEFAIEVFQDKVGVSLEECLQEKYRGHNLSFWKILQILHDNNTFWNKRTLTEEGKKFIDEEFGFEI